MKFGRVSELEAVELTKELIKIPSVARSKEISSFVFDWLKEVTDNVRVIERNGVYNVIAEIGEGRPVFVLNGHMDVVPANPEGWKHDPFDPVIEGDRLYGRGSNDMKGGLAGLMVAFKRLSKRSIEGKVILMAVGDEEVGGFNGTGYLVNVLEKPDYVLVGEGTDMMVKVGRRGVIWTEVEIIGTAMHASRVYEKRRNPIEICSEFSLFLRDLDFDEHFENMPKTTSVMTVIQAGERTNVVPRSCRAKIDTRNTPKVNPEILRNVFTNFLEGLRKKYGEFEYKLDIKELAIPYYLKDTKISKITLDILEEFGYPGKVDASGGASDGRFFVMKGVKNVVELGPRGENEHGVNEWVSVKDLRILPEIYEKIVLRAFNQR